MTTPSPAAESELVAFRRLSVRGTLFVLALLLTCAALLRIPAPANDFLQVIQDKLRVLSAAQSPRTLLVGGSSTAFGFNSAEISAATGRSVINMGVHAGLGLEFMLRSVEDSLRAGDLVVVSPEYELFDKGHRDNTVLFQILPYMRNPDTYLRSVGERVEYRLQLRVQRLQRIVAHLIKSALGKTPPPDIYRRDIFNALGDVALPDSTRSTLDVSRFKAPAGKRDKADEGAIRRLFAFAERAGQRGASVMIIYPPLVSDAFTRDSAHIAELQRTLETSLGPVITFAGQPQDFAWPAADFFDTEYHLNPRGREKRTARVIELLLTHRSTAQ